MKGRTSMKARLGIATAVLVGGGAIGVAAVATGSHNTTTNAQSSAYGYTLNFHHTMSEGAALSAALNQWSKSHQKAMTTLAQMQSMRAFAQTASHHKTLVAQRGVVVLATKKFLLVQSAKNPNGTLHLWWLKGTAFANVSSNATGMTAMTGNNNAAFQAMQHNNMAPATTAMTGSTTAVNQMVAPVAKPTTITVATGNTTITITIAQTTATVAQTTPTTTGMATTKTKQPVFTHMNNVARGDLVLVSGVRTHGQLQAKLVLFAAPTTTVTPTPSASVTPTTTPTVTTTPTTAPSTAIMPTGVSGTHS
jgi:hypothetical protein